MNYRVFNSVQDASARTVRYCRVSKSASRVFDGAIRKSGGTDPHPKCGRFFFPIRNPPPYVSVPNVLHYDTITGRSGLRAAVILSLVVCLTAGACKSDDNAERKSITSAARAYDVGSSGQEGSSPIYDISELDTQPDLINKLEMIGKLARTYPSSLRKAHVGGSTVVEFVVSKSGEIEDESIRIIESSDPQFASASELVVRSLKFLPGRIAHATVRVRMQLPITWNAEHNVDSKTTGQL